MLRHPHARTLALVAGYILCFRAVRLVALTIITYTVSHGSTGPSGLNEPGGLQRIGDVLHANLSLTYGAAAFIYVLILHALYPLARTQLKNVFNLRDLRDCFAPNALNGLILTLVLVMGTSLGGYMSYLGIYMKFDEVVISLVSSTIFGLGLFTMILVEEYILRETVEPMLGRDRPIVGGLLSSAVFLVFKYLQYDLSWIQVINLILLNLTLSMIARNERTFMASASFAGTFLVLVHVFFGLPFMEQDMPGILLLRGASDEGLGSLLSGGNLGPEAGLVLTVLLVIYLYLPQIRSKKIEV